MPHICLSRCGAPAVTLERDGPVAIVTLNRPDAGNAVDVAMTRALLEISTQCDEDEGIRCVVLTGAGRFFCVGGDVTSFEAAGDGTPALIKTLTALLHMAISRFCRMGKPLVTALNGATAGAGVGLGLMGDQVMIAHSAQITLAYTAIGLSPDAGATWWLPRLVGLRRAQQLILTNPRIDAAAALDMGLVTTVTDDADLLPEALVAAHRLAQSATPAIALTRRLLLSSLGASLEDQLEAEARAIADASRSGPGREGVAAFIARRKPQFWPGS